MSKKINCFGFDNTFYPAGYDQIEPYQFIKTDENTLYVRFKSVDPCPIIKAVKNGTEITQTWAYGNWADKLTLTYVPINELVEID